MVTHAMLDFETLGTGTNSVVLSIGAVKFEPNVLTESGEDKFYVRVDPEDCQRYGLVIDAGTVMWWLKHDRAMARDILLTENVNIIPLDDAIEGFCQWWAASPVPTAIWSNGASFDIMIMRNLLRVTNHKCPWEFWEERCFRTLKSLVQPRKVPPAHHALDDAMDQAHQVQGILQTLGVQL